MAKGLVPSWSETQGQVVLITGAGSGIGRAAAELFAERGALVVAADRSESGAETAEKIRAAGGTACFVRADVSVETEVEAMVAITLDRYGALDAAFNNAGVAPPVGPLETIGAADWERALAVNLRGVWLCMKYELAVMVPRRAGSIVNTSSVAGVAGCPGSAGYAAAKHGVVGLTRSAAAEHGRHGVRVNAIAPGLTETGMLRHLRDIEHLDVAGAAAGTPLGRIAEPREIAEAAYWLASPRASFVTGHVLSVDGGETAAP
ncbi:SDR family NAD(P)-dependent oxidoreductase [Streptomyces sp. NPDC058464]|uniref:SDR family NAD(P)-dependent oxidoreductase n=1 Tax=Streptomyces sp. NPDC058464 TaxID=3346511 RepID=UPI00364D814F